jgi:hypothetical protein
MNKLNAAMKTLFSTLKNSSADFRSKFEAPIISGCPGIGKSTFVQQFLYNLYTENPDNNYFIFMIKCCDLNMSDNFDKQIIEILYFKLTGEAKQAHNGETVVMFLKSIEKALNTKIDFINYYDDTEKLFEKIPYKSEIVNFLDKENIFHISLDDLIKWKIFFDQNQFSNNLNDSNLNNLNNFILKKKICEITYKISLNQKKNEEKKNLDLKKKIKELEDSKSSFYKEYTNYIDMSINKLTNFFFLMLQLVNAAANVGIVLAPIFSGTNYLDMYNIFGFSGRSCIVIDLELFKLIHFENICYALLDLIKKIKEKISAEEFKLMLPNIIKFFFQITVGQPRNIEKYIIAISQTHLKKNDDDDSQSINEIKTGDGGKTETIKNYFYYKNFIENIKYLNKISNREKFKHELINSMNKILKQYEILVQQDINKLSSKLNSSKKNFHNITRNLFLKILEINHPVSRDDTILNFSYGELENEGLICLNPSLDKFNVYVPFIYFKFAKYF